MIVRFLSRFFSAAKSGSMMAASENLAYGYNARSELVSAVSDVDANYNYAYAFDHIGNRATEAVAGTENAYATNSLNQYTEIRSAEPNQQTATPSNQLSAFQLSYNNDGNVTLIQTSTGTWNVDCAIVGLRDLSVEGDSGVRFQWPSNSPVHSLPCI